MKLNTKLEDLGGPSKNIRQIKSRKRLSGKTILRLGTEAIAFCLRVSLDYHEQRDKSTDMHSSRN